MLGGDCSFYFLFFEFLYLFIPIISPALRLCLFTELSSLIKLTLFFQDNSQLSVASMSGERLLRIFFEKSLCSLAQP
jgi:hypothetical protein